MAYVDIKNKPYSNWSAIEGVLSYIFRDGDISYDCIGGYGVIFIDENYLNAVNALRYPDSVYFVESIINQFQTVKRIYGKEKYKLLKHIIITFAPGENVTCAEAAEIAWRFISYFDKGYQVVFAVHTDSDNIHIHIVLNTTNVISGNNYNNFCEAEELNDFLAEIMSNRKYK